MSESDLAGGWVVLSSVYNNYIRHIISYNIMLTRESVEAPF